MLKDQNENQLQMQCSQKLHSISHPPYPKREANTYISNLRIGTMSRNTNFCPRHVHLDSIFQLNLNQHIGLKKKKKKRNEHKKLKAQSQPWLKPVSSSTRACTVGDVERRTRSTEGSEQKNEIRQVFGTFDDEAKTAE